MIYRVKEPFAYTDGRGVPRIANAGDLVSEQHDAYTKSRRQFMEPIEDVMARATDPIETATAAPGEKRSLPAPPPPPVVKAPADDLEALRKAAEDAGVKVDKRWGAEKLRAETEAAKAASEDKE